MIMMILSVVSVSAQTCPGGNDNECKEFCENKGYTTPSCDEDKMCGCSGEAPAECSQSECNTLCQSQGHASGSCSGNDCKCISITPPGGSAGDETPPAVQDCAAGEMYSVSTQKCVKMCPDPKKPCSAANINQNLIVSPPGQTCKNDAECTKPLDPTMFSNCDGGRCHYYPAPDNQQSDAPGTDEDGTGTADTGTAPPITEEDIGCPEGALQTDNYCGSNCDDCMPTIIGGKDAFCVYGADGETVDYCWISEGGTYTKYDPRTQNTDTINQMQDVNGGLCFTENGKTTTCEGEDGTNYDFGGVCTVPGSTTMTSDLVTTTITGCGTTEFCAGQGTGGFDWGGCPGSQQVNCGNGEDNQLDCVDTEGSGGTGTWDFDGVGEEGDIPIQTHCVDDDCEICMGGSCYGGATQCGSGDCNCEGVDFALGYCDESGKPIIESKTGIHTEGECNEVGCDTDYMSTEYTEDGVTTTYGTEGCTSTSSSCDCASTTYSHGGQHSGSTLCGHDTAFVDSNGNKCHTPGEGTCMLRWEGGTPLEIRQKTLDACAKEHEGDHNAIANCARNAADSDVISCDDDLYGDAAKEACEEMMWDAYEGGGFDTIEEVFDNVADGLAKGVQMANSFCGVAASWSGYKDAASMGEDKGGFNMCYWDNPMSRFLESVGEIFSTDAMADSLCRKHARKKVGGAGYTFDPENPYAGSMQVEAEVFSYDDEDIPQPHLLYKIQVYMSAGFLCSVSDGSSGADWDQEDESIEDLDGWSGDEHLRFQLVLKNNDHTHTIDWDKENGEMPTDLVLACNSSGFQLSGSNMLIRRMLLAEHPGAYEKICIRFLPATDAPKGEGNEGSFDIYKGETISDDDARNAFNLVSSIYKEMDKGLNKIHTVSMSHLTPTPVGSTNMKVGDFCNKIVGSDLDLNVDAYADYPLEEESDVAGTGASYGQDASDVGGGIVND